MYQGVISYQCVRGRSGASFEPDPVGNPDFVRRIMRIGMVDCGDAVRIQASVLRKLAGFRLWSRGYLEDGR